jgi:hypothetical protein
MSVYITDLAVLAIFLLAGFGICFPLVLEAGDRPC